MVTPANMFAMGAAPYQPSEPQDGSGGKGKGGKGKGKGKGKGRR